MPVTQMSEAGPPFFSARCGETKVLKHVHFDLPFPKLLMQVEYACVFVYWHIAFLGPPRLIRQYGA